MKGRFRQDWIAGKQRLGDLFCYFDRPGMVSVVPIAKSDDKSGVRDAFHPRENPRRCERSFAPLDPARVPQESLLAFFGPGLFELLADNAPGGQAGFS